jgi:hypothetical protein
MSRRGSPGGPVTTKAPRKNASRAQPATIATVIRRLLRERGAEKSICPSEVARELAKSEGEDDWRRWMQAVRDAAAELADLGEVVITQRGDVVDARTARGAIRFASRAGRSGGTRRP